MCDRNEIWGLKSQAVVTTVSDQKPVQVTDVRNNRKLYCDWGVGAQSVFFVHRISPDVTTSICTSIASSR